MKLSEYKDLLNKDGSSIFENDKEGFFLVKSIVMYRHWWLMCDQSTKNKRSFEELRKIH